MDVVQKVADRGAFVAADRVLIIIRAVYNWAISTGRLDVNPTLGLKKRNASGPRERVLDDDEIRALWRRLDTPSKLSQEIRDALKLQLLLGVRIGEALGAAKSEIDLSRRVWSIPAFRTKVNANTGCRLQRWRLASFGRRSIVQAQAAGCFPPPKTMVEFDRTQLQLRCDACELTSVSAMSAPMTCVGL